MKKYKGQVLEIVLVLLLVGSILGFALYARFIRESERVVDEKASAEANELTETFIGLVSSSDYEKLKDENVLEVLDCNQEQLKSSECRKAGLSMENLNTYFERLGVDGANFEVFDFNGDYCSAEVAMRYGLADDEVTIEQDESYSIFLDSANWSSCEVNFIMRNNGFSDGFVMSLLYGDYLEGELVSYKEYESGDIIGFTYSDVSKANWQPYSSGIQPLSFPSTYGFEKEDYKLHEVRFKSLGGSSNLRWEVSDFGCEIDEYMVMEVGATCGGKYVGKQFIIPGEVFSPALFDYVLFNGTGPLVPEKIIR